MQARSNIVAEICRRYDLWLHVDGAYGGSAIFSDQHRSLLRGIERADSITIDPHKWMAMPLASGVILTCHPEILERAFAGAAPYMPKAAESAGIDNSRISTQWTRRTGRNACQNRGKVTRDGKRWISETKVNGHSVLRMMVISYLTEERHLLELENALTETVTQLASTGPRSSTIQPLA
jgi:glutamate/tyrosine decarboxylase-like PLP-dependent enzyme